MLTVNQTDRYHIERKYHDPDKEFDPFKRMAYHGEGYLEDSGLDDGEILAGLEALSKETEELPHPVAKALAIKYVLENERLYVNGHDFFVGLYSTNRLIKQTTFSRWEAQSKKLRDPDLVKLSKAYNDSGAVMIWTDYDHVVPDFGSLMALGFSGIRQRARDYRAKNGDSPFYQAIEIQYTAIIGFIDRLYNAAAAAAFEKAPRMAACLEHLRDGAPTDFYEALQLIYIYFIISESVDCYQVRSLGNGLDHTLYSFYKNDLDSGRYTEADIRELLSYFLLQWSAIGNYWGQPFYLGGTNLDGSTRYNALSYIILDVYDELEIYNPKIQLKINKNTPSAILDKAFDMVRRKNASLVFCCEPAMMKAAMGYGATAAEAHDYDIRGCYEIGVRANEVSATSGYVNAAKAVELVFSNGFDRKTGMTLGADTGDLSEMTAFEDFYFAFLKQWDRLISGSMAITDDAERFLEYVNPSTMYSATIETALKNGRDGYGGGVKFNNSAMLNCGFASAVDSVMAVKELVYDKKLVSLTELKNILDGNWQGSELLRLKIRNSPHKYGSGDPETDRYASAMAKYFADRVNNKPNGRGGVYKAIMHSARAFIKQGADTGALPDGRLAGGELSKNASPVPGMDKNGVTALVSSAAALCPSDYHESFCLDVMLHPSAVTGEDGLAVMKGILMTYLEKGGQSIQFNIFNSADLRDAQAHPEKYQSLQVRVCGWNVLWNDLTRAEQDNYILRAENVQ